MRGTWHESAAATRCTKFDTNVSPRPTKYISFVIYFSIFQTSFFIEISVSLKIKFEISKFVIPAYTFKSFA